MNVTLLSYTANPFTTIAKAASTCYNSKPSKKIVLKCIESGHTSVLEHASFTFHISGVSRSLLAQITRHRIASFSVRSQRYCNENDNEFVVPDELKSNEPIIQTFSKIKDVYTELVENGVKAEDARYVLPNACSTEMVMTMNLRSLGNFMNERLCARAQLEIRQVANAMRQALLSVDEFDETDKLILKKMLVPKCEKGSIAFCPELKGCGRHANLKELLGEETK